MKLYHRIRYFLEFWRTDDPWLDGAKIDAAFAWDLAGAFADHHDELSQWEELVLV